MGYEVRTLSAEAWGEGGGSLYGSGMVGDMLKAMEAGTGVDAAQFTGGRALQYESLDSMLATVLLTAEDATLFRMLPKRPLSATVDQYDRRTSYGGGRWGRAVPESSNPPNVMASLERAFTGCKYYRNYREVSDVSLMVNSIVKSETEEEEAATIDIIQEIDRDLWSADEKVFPGRVQGVFALLNSGLYPRMFSASAGGSLLTGREKFEQIVTLMRLNGARATNAICNPLLQGDLSAAYMSAERIVLSGGAEPYYVGAEIAGIATSMGKITVEGDPFNEIGWSAPTSPEGVPGLIPATPTIGSGASAGVGGVLPTGAYYYQVTAVNENGESAPATIGPISVDLGEVVTLVLSDNDSITTGFFVYRSALNASDESDCRYLFQISLVAGGSPGFIDNGFWVPGTAHIGLFDMRPQAYAQQFSQLMPLSKKRLAEVGPTRPFLMNLYGAMRWAKPEWLGVMRNILPRAVYEGAYTDHRGEVLPAWNPLDLSFSV